MKQTLEKLDFNYWLDVASRDPAAFEDLRASLIDDFIEHAPQDRKARLRGLQWRIDQIRRKSGSPMGSCLRIYSMMWDSLVGKDGMFDRLETLAQENFDTPEPRPKAKVLSLPKNS